MTPQKRNPHGLGVGILRKLLGWTRVNLTTENAVNIPVSYTHLDVYKRQTQGIQD